MMTLHDKLVHAATAHDRRNAARKPRRPGMSNGYNPYALGQYLMRIAEIEKDIAAGATPKAAILQGTMGPLRTALLKAIGEPADHSEPKGSKWHYVPASKFHHKD